MEADNIDPINIKKKKITWTKKLLGKAHPDPSRLSRVERGKWCVKTKACWLFAVKHSYTDYDGLKKTGSMLIDGPLSLGTSEEDHIAYINLQIKEVEKNNQITEQRRIQEELIQIVDEYEEET
ncbi:hypothetical protein KAR91_26620 [Candidatus Pacearchaeota archaeon]|nr:hypothetical protein [Candidatus Pacearchaeota archaeon]